MTYLEDMVVGTVRQFGQYAVTEDEIISFAKTYDNQFFHTDVEAAKGETKLASLGSPGFDNLKWLVPVRPGDLLSARTEILAATASRNKPDQGTVSIQVQVLNQTGAVVLEMTSMGRFLRRPS